MIVPQRKSGGQSIVWPQFEIFFVSAVAAFRQIYSPTEHLTLYKVLEAFRCRCRFVQYMPRKPAEYGIKLQCPCDDAETNYICNVEVYAGKQSNSPFQLFNGPHDVTLRLTAPIFGTGRNLTTDNDWYTSIPLAEDFLENKINLVGTMKKN